MQIEVFDHMEECTEEAVQYMLPLVSAQRREQALRYKHTFGKFCCLKSWMMLNSVCLLLLDKSPVTFLYNEHGKPYLENGPHFSISHCKEGIAVAVSEKPIGIDIESIRKADRELVTRVMNEREQALIKAQTDPSREFTRIWTQKEAIVKAQGVGITSFEQLLQIRDTAYTVQTYEQEKYIYSIAYG